MMRALYLANVGNSDLYLDGAPLQRGTARERGAEILQGYASYQGRLSAPILEAVLDHVLLQGTLAEPVEVTVRLFGTNQPESAGEHYKNDTLYVAKVLEKYLPERFPARSKAAGGGQRVIARIAEARAFEVRQNPSSYDEMYDFFGKELQKLDRALGQFDAYYVSPVGGVPAANFALLLRALDRFEDRCHPVYVPFGSPHPVPLDIGARLRRATLRRIVREQLASYEFGRAAALLRELGLNPALAHLAEHAQRRLDFDFHAATLALQRVLGAGLPAAANLARTLLADLGRPCVADERLLVRELYFNLAVAHQTGRYVDFLLRLFRFQEAVARFIVERELGLPTGAHQGKASKEFVAGIEARPALRDCLRAQRIEGNPIDLEREPSVPVLRLLVQCHVATGGPEAARYAEVAAALERLEQLAQLRNKSIGAHGFEGVSGGDIQAVYAGDLFADLRAMMAALELDGGPSPFDQVRDFIRACLAKEP